MSQIAVAPEPTLAVAGLSKSYDNRRVVGPLSFSLEAGSVTGLLGGNGAGKTTTIGMIMGLIEPTTRRRSTSSAATCRASATARSAG